MTPVMRMAMVTATLVIPKSFVLVVASLFEVIDDKKIQTRKDGDIGQNSVIGSMPQPSSWIWIEGLLPVHKELAKYGKIVEIVISFLSNK